METQTGNAKLFSKMAQVMHAVRTLEKTGRNTFDKYDYVTSDAIAVRVGGEMAKVGLALFPSIVSVETADYATKNGGNNFRTVVHMQITVACGETGATWTSDWYGEAIDRSDKSISKAAVSAVKYYLLKTFLLAGGDEEDADAQSPTVEAKQAPQKAAKPVDNPFEEPQKPRASDAQLQEINRLGALAYGDEWNANKNKLADWASKGVRQKIEELYAIEAQNLIKALEKKIAA